jgi:SAM-dependent methyltransferase
VIRSPIAALEERSVPQTPSPRPLAATGPNAEQIEYWNEKSGPKWVAHQERLDAQIGAIGEEVMARAKIQPRERVVDVGCGCGHTTLQLAERVGSRGRVLAVDISGVMLSRARERAAAAGVTHVDFLLADAQTASFPRNFDLVFSRFGVMFFADPVTAFANLRRALAPGGRLAFACWQSLERNPWMAVPLGTAAKLVSLPPPPPPGAPGPMALADPERVARILDQAGFRDVSLEAFETKLRVAGGGGVEEAAAFLLEGVGPTSQAMREASAHDLERVSRAVRAALEPYLTPRGVELGASVWIATANRG